MILGGNHPPELSAPGGPRRGAPAADRGEFGAMGLRGIPHHDRAADAVNCAPWATASSRPARATFKRGAQSRTKLPALLETIARQKATKSGLEILYSIGSERQLVEQVQSPVTSELAVNCLVDDSRRDCAINVHPTNARCSPRRNRNAGAFAKALRDVVAFRTINTKQLLGHCPSNIDS